MCCFTYGLAGRPRPPNEGATDNTPISQMKKLRFRAVQDHTDVSQSSGDSTSLHFAACLLATPLSCLSHQGQSDSWPAGPRPQPEPPQERHKPAALFQRPPSSSAYRMTSTFKMSCSFLPRRVAFLMQLGHQRSPFQQMQGGTVRSGIWPLGTAPGVGSLLCPQGPSTFLLCAPQCAEATALHPSQRKGTGTGRKDACSFLSSCFSGPKKPNTQTPHSGCATEGGRRTPEGGERQRANSQGAGAAGSSVGASG